MKRPRTGRGGAPAAGAVRAPLPEAQAPQLCAVAEEPPGGGQWASEIKFDGYRLIASFDRGRVRLLTRTGLDWTERLPAIARAVGQLPVGAAMLDGELIGAGQDGAASFSGLQAALRTGQDASLVFCAFDLLHLDGWDLRPCPLLERKRLLRDIVDWTSPLCLSEHYTGDPRAVWKDACRMHLEGIICKQVDAPYRAGRGPTWVKVKCSMRAIFLVLGWTPPRGSRRGIGALHLGYRDDQGRLHYAGGVGTGFTEQELEAFHTLLTGLETDAPADLLFAGDPIDPLVTWVRPKVVVEIRFTSWTNAGRVRHPVYLETLDQPARSVVMSSDALPDTDWAPFEPSGRHRTATASCKR